MSTSAERRSRRSCSARARSPGAPRVLTPRTGAAGDVIAAIVGTVRTSLEGAGAADGALRAVGIGTPGEIDAEAGAVLLAANVPGFSERVELGPIVSELVEGVEVKVGNDVSVGVLGEFSRGAGRPFRNLLGVWVGTGVGGGLILDGELHDGRGAGGEVGHMVVEPGGLRCPCGRRGCLEAYAGRARDGAAGAQARQAGPEDGAVLDHEEAGPHEPQLRRLRARR